MRVASTVHQQLAIPVIDPDGNYAHAIADVGYGVTDVAVIRRGRVVRSAALRMACNGQRQDIVGFVSDFIRSLPDELAVEVIESGLQLSGGGGQDRGLFDEVGGRTQLVVRRSPDPSRNVVRGARLMLPYLMADKP
jgi:actin-like ATPase involved in cell morphogenesis